MWSPPAPVAGGAALPDEPEDHRAARKLWTPPTPETRQFDDVRKLVLWARQTQPPVSMRTRLDAQEAAQIVDRPEHINGYNVYIRQFGKFGVRVMIPSRRMSGDRPFAHVAFGQPFHLNAQGRETDAAAFCTVCNSDRCYGCLWVLHEVYGLPRLAIPDPDETELTPAVPADDLPF